jgi:hypothetical protein
VGIDKFLNEKMMINKLTVVRTEASLYASQYMVGLNMAELYPFYAGCLLFGKFKLLPIIGHKWRIWDESTQLHAKDNYEDLLKARHTGRLLISQAIEYYGI